jgi:hypothetical protein
MAIKENNKENEEPIDCYKKVRKVQPKNVKDKAKHIKAGKNSPQKEIDQQKNE